MSVVLLARHGQASFGVGSYDRLSELGRLQIRQLATTLGERGTTVDRIIVGTLHRQRESAELLSSVLGGAPILTDPSWDEYPYMPLLVRVRPGYRRRWVMLADLARSGNPQRALQDLLDEALALWVSASDQPDALPAPIDLTLSPAADAESIVDPRTGELFMRPPGGVHAEDLPEDSATVAEPFGDYRARLEAALRSVSSMSGTTLVVSSAGTIALASSLLMGAPATSWPGMQRVMANASLTKIVRGKRGLSLISFNEHGFLEGQPKVRVTYR
jgi:broad specificity phosphatase PhoE